MHCDAVFLRKCILNSFLNWSSVGAFLMDMGMLFQILGAQMEMACCFVFSFFALLSLQSDGLLAAIVP